MSYRCDKSPFMLTFQVYVSTHLHAQLMGLICVCFSRSSMGLNSPARDWDFFVLHSISSQEDMVFVPKHFNVYVETMAWNKRREAERERDNEVSQLRESTPCTIELTWIIWKAPRVNSFTVLGCVRAAVAFTQLWWSVYSVFVLMWRMEDVVCLVEEGDLVLKREVGLPGFHATAMVLGNKVKHWTYSVFYSMSDEYNKNRYCFYYLS